MTSSQHTHETEIIIRFSHAWWVYMLARGGALRAMVNGLEDVLAITGRTLLLVFLLYCGVKSGALLVNPTWTPDLWLEMSMFVLQLAGLEGSIPGLARHADILRSNGNHKGATRVEGTMKSARIMTILTIGEGVLHLFGLDKSILQIISGVLLLVRGVVITSFLIELAKIEAKGPRVLSKAEHEREQQAHLVEGEQARIIADLRAQLEETVTSLSDALRHKTDQARTITELQEHITHLQTTTCNIADLQSAKQETAHLQKEMQILSANLHTAHLHIADLTAQVEQATRQVADLQTAHVQLADEPAPPAQARPAKSTEQRNITSIDEARARHEESGQGRAKVSHADVLAYLAANPDLKRAEVALRLGVSERKVYDALAWGKEQERASASAH